MEPLHRHVRALPGHVAGHLAGFSAGGRRMIDRVRLKEFDHQIGALFGLAKGVLLCVVITFFVVTLSESARQKVLGTYSGRYIAVLIKQRHARAARGSHGCARRVHRRIGPEARSGDARREVARRGPGGPGPGQGSGGAGRAWARTRRTISSRISTRVSSARARSTRGSTNCERSERPLTPPVKGSGRWRRLGEPIPGQGGWKSQASRPATRCPAPRRRIPRTSPRATSLGRRGDPTSAFGLRRFGFAGRCRGRRRASWGISGGAMAVWGGYRTSRRKRSV